LGDPYVLGRKLYDRAFVRLEIVLIVAEHHQPRVDEKRSEQIDDPMESFDQFGPREDHDHSQDEGSHDAPEKYPMLKLFRNLKERKDQQKHEQVIDRK